MIPGFTEVKN